VTTLLPLLGTLKPRRIVDYGCGLGDALDRLAREFAVTEAIGIDLSSTALDYASRHHPGYTFMRGDLDSLSTLRADLVTFFDVLEHLPDIPAALAAARRCAAHVALKIPLEKSWLIALLNGIGAKRPRSRFHESEGHLHELSRVEFDDLLQRAGLETSASATSFPPKHIYFDGYIAARMRARKNLLGRLKYAGYRALRGMPYALSQPVLKAVNGVDLFVLARASDRDA
jgi:SAM-dependent methyltransferase